jgi:hypothetical protein
MLSRRPARFLALFLGIWIAFTPVLIGSAANSMAVSAVASDTDCGGCDDCPDTGATPGTCAFNCIGSTQLVLTGENARGAIAPEIQLHPQVGSVLAGKPATPEPGPPKLISHL